MTLPADFSQQEHLQSVIRSWLNREVREYFADLGGDDWDPDILTPRGSLRVACNHEDTDSLLMTQLRWQLFERIRRSRFDVPYLGIPVSSFQESRKFRPQILMYFMEDLGDVDPDYSPVAGEISFRLMDYTTETITPAVAQTFANRIATSFGLSGAGYVWRKGKDMASYTDWARGYQLQLLTRSRAEAREVVTKVLDLQNDVPNWKRMNYNENEEPMEAFPTIPPTEFVYGEVRREPRRRPMADCRFQCAFLHVQGVPTPVILYDRSGAYSTALVSA